MTGFDAGHPCPECGEPFDPRPEHQHAAVFSAVALVSGAVSLLCSLVTLGIPAVMLAIVAFGTAHDVRQAPAAFRVRPGDRARARWGALLALGAVGVFVVYRVVGPAIARLIGS